MELDDQDQDLQHGGAEETEELEDKPLTPSLRTSRWILLAIGGLLVLLYVGKILLDFSASLVRLTAVVATVALPLIGGYFLLKFAYSIFLRPYMRRRRIEQRRERRAWREAAAREHERRQ